jgi:hypothetical protein
MFTLLGTLAVSGCVVGSGGRGGSKGGSTQISLQPGTFRYKETDARISVDGSIMTTMRYDDWGYPKTPRQYRQTGINTYLSEGGSTVATIIDQDTVRFNNYVWRRQTY